MAGLQVSSSQPVQWVPAPNLTNRKMILGWGSGMAQYFSSHIGGLWSAFHLTDTSLASERCILLG